MKSDLDGIATFCKSHGPKLNGNKTSVERKV